VDATRRAGRLGDRRWRELLDVHDELAGIAVHIAARVTAAARPGDILTSRTVRDLVVGSDITLLDQGAYRLKGVEGTWQLFMAPRP
jgi:class 3 adenylate cyclase